MPTALRRLAVVLTAAAALPALAGDPALKATNCTPTGALRGDPARGAELHLKHCADCHGVDGRAEVIVMHMDAPPRDQSDAGYMQVLPDAYLYLVTCKGGAAVGKNPIMPAWGDVLSDQDLKDLVAQIRSFSGT
jgi:cytochrome c oxidase cbb3-type subunit 3